MSQKANVKLIGLFVVGALILVVATVIFLASGKFFGQKTQFSLFFKGDISGLSVGAPVKFRGVDIGTVQDIAVEVNQKKLTVNIPVVIEIDTNKMKFVGGYKRQPASFFQQLIKNGLRAQLKMESLITGQLYIDLRFAPQTKINLADKKTKYIQLPTLPASSAELENIVKSVRSTLDGINELVHSPDLKKAIKSLNAALESAHDALDGTNELVRSPDLEKAIQSLNTALESARNAFDSVNNLAKSPHVDKAIKSFDSTMASSDKTMKSISNRVQPATVKFEKSMDELSDALRSINTLVEYLSRHPEALLQGKGTSKGRK